MSLKVVVEPSKDSWRRSSVPERSELIFPGISNAKERRYSGVTLIQPKIIVNEDTHVHERTNRKSIKTSTTEMASRSTSRSSLKSTYLLPTESRHGDARKKTTRTALSANPRGRRTALAVHKPQDIRSQSAVALHEPTKDKWKLHAQAHVNSLLEQMEDKDKWSDYVKKHISKNSNNVLTKAEKKVILEPNKNVSKIKENSSDDDNSSSSSGSEEDGSDSSDSEEESEIESDEEQVIPATNSNTLKETNIGAKTNSTKKSSGRWRKAAKRVKKSKSTNDDPLKSLEESIIKEHDRKLKAKYKDNKSEEIDKLIKELNLEN
ncbi:transcription initiation factor TFIID subunit 11-like [Hydractinia symbiolongicarpus]|uniref:transcription initiation factor TFIID subunit 11-like n=1 Tax=Hydractinia symbiolongicarpus TaxID=13093 RepID=UPI00254C1ACE|nr:transcription initiation factor TFIID subunit 11-like [Hydractinia symbiolongicarpus]